MYKRTGGLLSLALALALTSTAAMAEVNETAQVQSNIKPIPKAFIGKWAGLHDTKKKLNKAGFKDLCANGGEQDTSYFIEFDQNRQRLTELTYWEDISYEYPVSYSKYTPTHVAGQSLSIYFEMGSDDDLAGKHVGKFDYKIVNGKLTMTTDYQTIELMRCDQAALVTTYLVTT